MPDKVSILILRNMTQRGCKTYPSRQQVSVELVLDIAVVRGTVEEHKDTAEQGRVLNPDLVDERAAKEGRAGRKGIVEARSQVGEVRPVPLVSCGQETEAG